MLLKPKWSSFLRLIEYLELLMEPEPKGKVIVVQPVLLVGSSDLSKALLIGCGAAMRDDRIL